MIFNINLIKSKIKKILIITPVNLLMDMIILHIKPVKEINKSFLVCHHYSCLTPPEIIHKIINLLIKNPILQQENYKIIKIFSKITEIKIYKTLINCINSEKNIKLVTLLRIIMKIYSYILKSIYIYLYIYINTIYRKNQLEE